VRVRRAQAGRAALIFEPDYIIERDVEGQSEYLALKSFESIAPEGISLPAEAQARIACVKRLVKRRCVSHL
jgi:hypothetical protein